MEAAAKHMSTYNKPNSEKSPGEAHMESMSQESDSGQLCPDCHAKIQKHLAKMRGPAGNPGMEG